jgi:exosortase/archaeosortase family protein
MNLMFDLTREQRIFLFRSSLIILLYMIVQYTPLFDLLNFKLTTFISMCSRWFLINTFAESMIENFWNGRRWVISNGGQSLHIGNQCNGYGLIIMYCGFIMSTMHYAFSRKFIFLMAGSVLIVFFNIVRVVLLFVLKNSFPTSFDLFHHYIFQISVYLLIFGLWFYFLKSNDGVDKSLN